MAQKFYEGEVLLMNWGHTARNGMTITLQLNVDALGHTEHPFQGFKTGKNGQRFGMRFFPILDDETPASFEAVRQEQQAKPQEARRRLRDLPRSQQAALLLDNRHFWRYVETMDFSIKIASSEAADAWLKKYFNIKSKSELKDDKFAQTWQTFTDDFNAYVTTQQYGESV